MGELDMVGYKEIAEQTGIPVNTLRQLKRRGDLPDPEYAGGPAWLQTTIDAWWANRPDQGKAE